jgi:hypothetical protein
VSTLEQGVGQEPQMAFYAPGYPQEYAYFPLQPATYSNRLHPCRSHNNSQCPQSNHSNKLSGTIRAISNNQKSGTREISTATPHSIHGFEVAPKYMSHPSNGLQEVAVEAAEEATEIETTQCPLEQHQHPENIPHTISSTISPAVTTWTGHQCPLEYRDTTCHM